ncbi:MAG: biopolymer transporter ExbD [Planctomycetota bacterium]
MTTNSDQPIEMDMTPMIDVVFQLIIFFILITDMTQSDLEELKLPIAKNSVQDKPDPSVVRPVLNVLPDGRMISKRRELYNPEKEDSTDVERYLSDQARLMPKKKDEAIGIDLPDNPLLIRADKNTEFKHIQKIMEICGKKGIQIWKLQLAASEDPAKVEAREAADD